MIVDGFHFERATPFQEGVAVRGEVLEEHILFVELGDVELVGDVRVGAGGVVWIGDLVGHDDAPTLFDHAAFH